MSRRIRKHEPIDYATEAAFNMLVELDQQPEAVMVVALLPDGHIRISDGGVSKEAAMALIYHAAESVEDYADVVIARHRKELH